MKFSGFVAWWMWRSVYLAKLPGLAKKLRVAMGWTLDLFFGREIEQTITARDIEATAEQIGRIRARSRFTYPSLEAGAVAANERKTYAV
jgi:NADH:ubiquinone reductase (H+-translocating)